MSEDGIHPVDIHIGLRIRARRKELNLSQQAVADAIGVSFQQVQKYERGANRVSASMMWEISKTLGIDPGAFFHGLPNDISGERPDERSIREYSESVAGRNLIFAALRAPAEMVECATVTLTTVAECIAEREVAQRERSAQMQIFS